MTPERKQTIIASAALTVHWLLICDLLDNLGQSAPSGDARSWLPPVPQALTDYIDELFFGNNEYDIPDMHPSEYELFGSDLGHHLMRTGGGSLTWRMSEYPRLTAEYDQETGAFWEGMNKGTPCPEVKAFILSMEQS